MSSARYIRRKIVVVGSGRSGKTWLLSAFYTGHCPGDFGPSIMEGYTAEREVDKQSYELLLWDTPSQEDYDRLRPLSYQGANVVLICFAVNDPDSLADITKKWVVEVKRHCPNVPIILVGCKTDLRHDYRAAEALTRIGLAFVTTQEGQAVADAINAYKYLECSAKSHDGLEDVFQHAVRASMIKIKKPGRSCIIC